MSGQKEKEEEGSCDKMPRRQHVNKAGVESFH